MESSHRDKRRGPEGAQSTARPDALAARGKGTNGRRKGTKEGDEGEKEGDEGEKEGDEGRGRRGEGRGRRKGMKGRRKGTLLGGWAGGPGLCGHGGEQDDSLAPALHSTQPPGTFSSRNVCAFLPTVAL